MRIDVVSAFPKAFACYVDESIIKRAREKGHLQLFVHDLRDFTKDKHRQIDDTPYGGGPGMLLKVEPFYQALQSIPRQKKSSVILLSPQGELLKQKVVQKLTKFDQLILLCGHYEGVDERVRSFIDEEISIGDYVITGGELPAMVLMDAVTRKLAGVLGSAESLVEESFEQGLLEYPQFTKPAEFKEMKVPDILLSGHHGEIQKWRQVQAIKRTKARRPDLLKN